MLLVCFKSANDSSKLAKFSVLGAELRRNIRLEDPEFEGAMKCFSDIVCVSQKRGLFVFPFLSRLSE